MLFHIKQSHAPQDCPYGKGGSRSLFDGESKDVKIHGYWLAFPQHTTYLVVETATSLTSRRSSKPGAGRTICRDHARQRQACALARQGAPWRAYPVGVRDEMDDEEMVAVYCPECAAREFGGRANYHS